ncbi:MAG: outer membrane protein assembly factor BamB [Gammaproteobacteria bacterium]|nr:outer membrane protein assembly factor BamB [Gammaproteobacteria bacterium]
MMPVAATNAARPALRIMPMVPVALLCLSGCGIFGGDDGKEARQPRELETFAEQLRLRRAWSARAGDGGGELRLALRLDGDGSRVYAASADGAVQAYGANNGARQWSRDTKLRLSAGPAAGGGYVAVASSGGWVIVLDAASGAEEWRAYVKGEVLAAPAVGGGRLFVRTVHGFLYAFSLATGQELWSVSQNMPRLSLRGTSAPVVQAQLVICGFDNGRLTAYEQSDGARVWDLALAAPAGRNELERLVDLNGEVQVVGNDVYVAGYNGLLAAVAAESGELLWSREFSGYNGLAVDANNVYSVSEAGRLGAHARTGGTPLWSEDLLEYRDLSRPALFASHLMVGDFEGYLHGFNVFNGKLEARARAGNSRIAAQPLVMGEMLYVLTVSGELTAWRAAGSGAS